MERPNTIAGLVEKRAEIAGRIRDTQKLLSDLVTDLDHIDNCIRMFDPEGKVKLRKPKTFPAQHAAFKGEMQRHVLGALRAATEPLTSIQIAAQVLKSKGLNPDDKAAMGIMRKRVNASTNALKRKGLVREVPLPGSYKGWKLA